MEGNDFNNNSVNTDIEPTNNLTVDTNSVQPIVEETINNVNVETPAEVNVVPPVGPQNNKTSGGQKCLLVVIVLILLMAAVVGVLVVTGKLDFGNKKETVKQEEKKQELSYKSVYNVNLEKKSNTKLGDTIVTVTQSEKTYNGDVVGLEATSVKVNDVELVDKVNIGGIDSYTIFYKYVIFLSSNNSGSLLSIYNVESGAVKSYDPENLFGYGVNSYYIEDNKIMIIGGNRAQQSGMTDPGYKKAKIEIAFIDGAFGDPKIVKELDKKAEYINMYDIKGDSQTTFNNISLNIKQVDDGTHGSPVVNSVTVNGKEIKDKLDSLSIGSYSIVDNYVIFLLYSTSHTELRIYDINTDSIITTYDAIGGYMINDYSFVEDFIVIDGRNASQQVGEPDPGYDYAQFRVNYAENKFSRAEKINEYNESDIIR